MRHWLIFNSIRVVAKSSRDNQWGMREEKEDREWGRTTHTVALSATPSSASSFCLAWSTWRMIDASAKSCSNKRKLFAVASCHSYCCCCCCIYAFCVAASHHYGCVLKYEKFVVHTNFDSQCACTLAQLDVSLSHCLAVPLSRSHTVSVSAAVAFSVSPPSRFLQHSHRSCAQFRLAMTMIHADKCDWSLSATDSIEGVDWERKWGEGGECEKVALRKGFGLLVCGCA